MENQEKEDTLRLIEENYKAANNSFVYLLHERDLYDTDAFARLLDCINSLDEGEETILEQLNAILRETLKHIIYHFDPDDSSRIPNLPEDYWAYLTDLEDAVGKYARMCSRKREKDSKNVQLG